MLPASTETADASAIRRPNLVQLTVTSVAAAGCQAAVSGPGTRFCADPRRDSARSTASEVYHLGKIEIAALRSGRRRGTAGYL